MKYLIIALLLVAGFGTVSAQQTKETKLDYEQILDITENHIIVGQAGSLANTIMEFIAGNMPVTPQNGISSTNVQAALEELQAEIIGGGDGWGADVVESDNTLSGDGTTGSLLSVNSANLNTADFNNDAGFITNANDADADPANEFQTINKSGSTVTLSDGGGSFTDEVNDADADAGNELQTLSINNGVATLSLGGGNVEVFDPYTTEKFTPTSGNTITISALPNTIAEHYIIITRGGLVQSWETSGTSSDVTVSGTTLTFNYRSFGSDEFVKVRYIQQ